MNRWHRSIKLEFEVARMEPLFATQEDYDEFNERHSRCNVDTGDLATYKGNCFPWYRCRIHHNKSRSGR